MLPSWPRSKMVQGQQTSNIMVLIGSMSQHLICHHCQIIWCQILITLNWEGWRSSGVNVHSAIRKPRLVSYLTSFHSNIVSLTVLEIFNVKVSFHTGMVKINSASGLMDMHNPDFHQKNRQPHHLALYCGGKFGEDWWRTATCRQFTSFVWQIQSVVHRQTDFMIRPMRLMHWADINEFSTTALLRQYVNTVDWHNINNAIYNNKGTGKMSSDSSNSAHICRRAASGDKRAVFWALFIGVRRRKGSTLKDAFVLVSNKHFNTLHA